MKHVYIATYDSMPVVVARSRKRLRKAVDRHWRLDLGRTDRLVWRKSAWPPLVRARNGMGLAAYPGLEWAPYDIDKMAVL